MRRAGGAVERGRVESRAAGAVTVAAAHYIVSYCVSSVQKRKCAVRRDVHVDTPKTFNHGTRTVNKRGLHWRPHQVTHERRDHVE